MNLGDVVLATSAAAWLKKANPSVRVTMLVRPFAAEIMENNPVVDDVLVFSYKAKQRSWGTMRAMIERIRREKYDLCISLDRKLRPAICTFLARIPVRVVPERIFDNKPSRVTWFYNHVVPMPSDFIHTPQAENFQTPLRRLFNLPDLHTLPVIGLPQKNNVTNAEKLLAELPAKKLRVALCVQGSFPLKTWPKEHFVALIKMLLAQYDACFYIVGTAGDSVYAAEFLTEGLPIVNFCGRTSLKDLAVLFDRSNLLVTVDTGALHIAATTSVPIVAMYGCGPADRWPPLTEKRRIITTHEDCSPCHYAADACPYLPRPKCQWNITPEVVFQACAELLKE